jgi:hypothetical protein
VIDLTPVTPSISTAVKRGLQEVQALVEVDADAIDTLLILW